MGPESKLNQKEAFDQRRIEKPPLVMPEEGKEKEELEKEGASQELRKIAKEEKPQFKVSPPTAEAPQVAKVKPPLTQEVENILSEGLEEVYQRMDESQKKIFKEKGEKTASKIAQLLEEVKVQVKKILGLIRDWLRLIPSVNRFFLEQEAKIKTDKILALKQRQKK